MKKILQLFLLYSLLIVFSCQKDKNDSNQEERLTFVKKKKTFSILYIILAYIQKILKHGKIHHIRMILSQITYPLSPKIKPILTVYANV